MRYFHVRRADVAFLRFVIEACDGLAQLTTIDAARSTVAVFVPPGCEADIDALVRGLRTRVPMEPAPSPALPDAPQGRSALAPSRG